MITINYVISVFYFHNKYYYKSYNNLDSETEDEALFGNMKILLGL